MDVESLHGPLHAHSWKLAESGRDRDQSFRPPVPGKTQDRRYWPTAPSNQSLESAHKPPSDHHSVEVHPKTGPTEAKLLNHTVIVLGEGVTNFSVGDAVAWWGPLGSYAEKAVVAAGRLVGVPSGVDLQVTAALMAQSP